MPKLKLFVGDEMMVEICEKNVKSLPGIEPGTSVAGEHANDGCVAVCEKATLSETI